MECGETIVRLEPKEVGWRRSLALLVCCLGAASLISCQTSSQTSDASDVGSAEVSADCSSDQCSDLAAVCPPPGPFGTVTGALIDDLEFVDPQGSTSSLHDLCGTNLVLLYHFYGW